MRAPSGAATFCAVVAVLLAGSCIENAKSGVMGSATIDAALTAWAALAAWRRW